MASYFKENAFTTCTVPTTTVPGKGILFWELINNTEIIILVTHVMLYSSEKFNSNDTNSTIFGLQYFQRLKKTAKHLELPNKIQIILQDKIIKVILSM